MVIWVFTWFNQHRHTHTHNTFTYYTQRYTYIYTNIIKYQCHPISCMHIFNQCSDVCIYLYIINYTMDATKHDCQRTIQHFKKLAGSQGTICFFLPWPMWFSRPHFRSWRWLISLMERQFGFFLGKPHITILVGTMMIYPFRAISIYGSLWCKHSILASLMVWYSKHDQAEYMRSQVVP